MARVRKPPAYGDVVAALSGQWTVLVAAADALGPADLGAPSPLPGWDTAALLGHLAATVERTAALSAAPDARCPGPGQVTLDALTWWAAPDQGPEDDGPGDAARLRDAVAAATAVLAAVPGERVVAPGIRLGDYALTRLVEAVVHGLDLGVAPDRTALRLTVRLLVDILAARVPGRSVELRVPPFAAVQILEGTRHTRGTPPAVVEADPLAWVAVATGRRPWAEALADGGVRASGGRSDLSPYLPVLS